jgi:hypothetical protein
VNLIIRQPDTEKHRRRSDRRLQPRLGAAAALTGGQHLRTVERRADGFGERCVGGGVDRHDQRADALALPVDVGRDAVGGVLVDEAVDGLLHPHRILIRDETEGQLDEGVARHDRLVPVALIAATDAVDLGGRPRAEPFERAEAPLAVQRA